MIAGTYRKVATIDAVKLTLENRDEVVRWVRAGGTDAEVTERGVAVHTLEGPIDYGLDYWIVKNETGEFYGILDDRFTTTYVQVLATVEVEG